LKLLDGELDKRGGKDIIRMERKKDFGLGGIKKGMLLKLKHTKTVR
jgi:hypothetical protein